MPSVAYPLAYAALLDLIEDLPNLRVTDGWDVSNDPSDVLMLGVPNLSDESAISAGNFSQEQIGHGAAGVIQEEGSVNGLVVAWNGEATDAGALAARLAAFEHLDDLNAAIRVDRSLGLDTETFTLKVLTAFSNGDIAEDKVNGATCAISFTVNYTALLGA